MSGFSRIAGNIYQPSGGLPLSQALTLTSSASNNLITGVASPFLSLASFRTIFITSSTAGTRQVQVQLVDQAGNSVWETQFPSGQAASSTDVYCIDCISPGPGYNPTSANKQSISGMALWLPPGWQWQLLVVGLQTGDAFSASAIAYYQASS